jgi:hypothetical protein
MLDRVLALRSKSLKWIFIEPAPVQTRIGQEDSLRNLHWRDADGTALVLRRVWENAQKMRGEPAGFWMRFIKDAAPHITMFARNSLNLGLLASRKPPERERDTPPERAAGYSFTPTKMSGAGRERYAAQMADFALQKDEPPDPLTQQAFASALARAKRRGCNVVCFIPPTARVGHLRVARPPPGETVLAFNDPQKFPQLYEPDFRRDSEHLNDRGAEVFTRLLASDFANLLEQSREAPSQRP